MIASLAGCGDDGKPTTPATTVSTPRSTVLPPLSPNTAAPASGKLARAESCRQFFATVADFRMTDQQSAVAFSRLAQQTADPTLAAAIRRVADGFARNAESLSSAEVQTLCR
jgi:hypothetical protein